MKRLVAGGESFAPEAREYLAEVWGCPVHNTYGSTEGSMCGECVEHTGLHVPEDLVHMDVYDPGMQSFVRDGECGRIVLSTLIGKGEVCGTLLINYDTEDSSVVISRDRCECGRTHLRIMNPTREAETFQAGGAFFNRTDVERGVFQRPNMEYLTGEYEASLYAESGKTTLQVSMECLDISACEKELVTENFLKSFLRHRPVLAEACQDGAFDIVFNFVDLGGLELSLSKGRPKRLVDRR